MAIGIWTYAADIVERAGATVLTLYALIVLCGAFLIYNTAKRTSPMTSLLGVGVWFLVAVLFLVVIATVPHATAPPPSEPTNQSADASTKIPSELRPAPQTATPTSIIVSNAQTTGPCAPVTNGSSIGNMTITCPEIDK